MKNCKMLKFTIAALLFGANAALGAQDIVFESFEGDSSNWQKEGSAFGAGWVKGGINGQKDVKGFKGASIANSFHGADAATGKITSALFKIERPYLNTLAGGGDCINKTYMRVLSKDGREIGRVSGSESETLLPRTICLSEYLGQEAFIEIVDDGGGHLGHIMVDDIVFSETPATYFSKFIKVRPDKNFMIIPIKNSVRGAKGARRILRLYEAQGANFPQDAKLLTLNDGEYDFADKPDWYGSLDVSAFKGKDLYLQADVASPQEVLSVSFADEIWRGDFPNDTYRPRFHYAPLTGWMNDPNGLIYYKGKYRMFHQYTPLEVYWAKPMNWFLAESEDLVHWKHIGVAIPGKLSSWGGHDMAFSGNAFFDKENKSGFFKEGGGAILAYTSTARGECFVITQDMRKFEEVDIKPFKTTGGDPFLFYYEPAKHWVLIKNERAAEGGPLGKTFFTFYVSKDLKNWERTTQIKESHECPNFYEVALENSAAKKWVLQEASGGYLIGDFDGREFKPQIEDKQFIFFGNCYAGQAWRDDPQGRAIWQIWLWQDPDEVAKTRAQFSQSMSLPYELAITQTPEGRSFLKAKPVKEFDALKGPSQSLIAAPVKIENKEIKFDKAAFASGVLDFEIDVKNADEVSVKIGEGALNCRIKDGFFTLSKNGKPVGRFAGLNAPSGMGDTLRLQAILDSNGLEISAQEGQLILCISFLNGAEFKDVSIAAKGAATLKKLLKTPVKSIYE